MDNEKRIEGDGGEASDGFENFSRELEEIATRRNRFRPIAAALRTLYSSLVETGFDDKQAMALVITFFQAQLGCGRGSGGGENDV